ncbi:MAG: hypothetical protein RR047_02645 [Bacilli bacterium]
MNHYIKVLELLKEYKKTEFWKIVSGEDILKIKGNKEEDVYVLILGNAGVDLGLIIFKNKEELFTQINMVYGEYANSPDRFVRADGFKICLDEMDCMLTEEEARILKKNKVDTNDTIIRLDRGKVYRVATDEECEFLIGVIEKIIKIANYFKDKCLKVTEFVDLEKMYAFTFSPEGNISHRKENFPVDKLVDLEVVDLNKKSVNKLLIFSKNGSYNVGLFYFPVYMNNESGKFYPLVLIIENRETGMIIGLDIFGEEEKESLANKVLGFLNEGQIRPKEITFSSFEALSLCRDLTRELDIEGLVDINIESLFDIWNKLSDEMTGNK